jgi:hypothetical protein
MQSHRALRALLTVLAVLVTLAGVTILFGPDWVFMVSRAPQIAAQPLLLLFAQAFGAVALPAAYLLYLASRDPVRHVAIIDAMVIGLTIVVVLEVHAILGGTLAQYFAPWLLWTSVVIRALLAVTLFALRPRGND